MQSKATTVAQYLAELPEDRREAIAEIRKVILASLPEGVAEGMTYGMIGYFVPHSIYPKGYHCDPRQPLPFASLASQKNHISLYLMNLYTGGDEKWLRAEWAKTGKRLDMGKCCVRFKRVEDVPLEVIGKAIARRTVEEHIKKYESALAAPRAKPAKPTAKKSAKKATKKAAKKAGGTKGSPRAK